MTAVRVLNPSVLSEFCKIRSASPSTVGRNLPCGQQLQRIKRNLFGPANPNETNQIFVEELELHQEKASKKWGFDFRAGLPLSSATNSQYIWERVSFQESVYAPEMYTLTRAAHMRPNPAQATAMDLLLNERAERENFSVNTSASTDTDSCDESQDESMVVFKVPAVVGDNSSEATTLMISCSNTPLRKRQPKITEYMKERKRLAQTPKKVTPAKRMRTSSGSSSNAHAPQSIASHFAPRNMQHHN